ncbi:hypothetical protein MUK42_11913 [Musa troglodytarum]|uniref:Uncharacterized protein n=1 Tax=Musa troglodytarum TaxID=320322 RepID=A0A9E7HDV5_9LILI|nr:hypothetical protein MUK42_11913 [Musa troglodytarum]
MEPSGSRRFVPYDTYWDSSWSIVLFGQIMGAVSAPETGMSLFPDKKKRAKNSGTTRKLGGAKQRDSVNCPDPLHSATDLDAWPYNKPWALRLPLKSTPQTLASTSILIVRREASSALTKIFITTQLALSPASISLRGVALVSSCESIPRISMRRSDVHIDFTVASSPMQLYSADGVDGQK